MNSEFQAAVNTHLLICLRHCLLEPGARRLATSKVPFPLPPPHLSPLTELEFQLLPWMLGFELRSLGLLSKSSHPWSDSPVSSFPLSPQVSFIHQNLPGVVSWNVACQNVPDFLNLKAAHILVNDYENVTGLLVCNLSRWGHLLTALWRR